MPVALLRGRVFLKLVPKYPPFEAVISSPEILYRRTPELMDLVEDSLDLDYKNPSDSCTMVETPQNSDSKSQLLISSDHEGETKG